MEEIWKPLPGWEGMYEVSNIGRVKCLERKVENGDRWWTVGARMIPENTQKDGYSLAFLSDFKRNIHRSYGIHKLVAMAFLGHKEDSRMVVDHINGIKNDNRVENLRVVTLRYNVCVGYRKDGENRKSIPRGAYQNKKTNRWFSGITINGIHKHLGTFDTKEEAGMAYQKALLEAMEND